MTALARATPALDAPTLARVRALVHGAAGIVISDAKAGLVQARLSKRLDETGFRDVASYLDHVEAPGRGDELTRLISAMTTNVTQFFREASHFEALAQDLVPRWAAEAGQRSVWSAGCATGQEAWSIAITLREAGLGRDRVRVLATDIDRAVLGRAAAGFYAGKEVAGLPYDQLRRHFQPVAGGWRADPSLRQMVTFRALNLIGEWPFSGGFDAIFCRNVAIYFDPPTQQRLWRRMIHALRSGGRLFIGHSERLPDSLLAGGISHLGRTMYARSAADDQVTR